MIEKQQPRKQRFGIRKLSIGVVSVLLGLLLIGGGNQAAADDQQPVVTVDASVVASTPIGDQITTNSASTLTPTSSETTVVTSLASTAAPVSTSSSAVSSVGTSPVISSQPASQVVASQQPVQPVVNEASVSSQPVNPAVVETPQPVVSDVPVSDASAVESTVTNVDGVNAEKTPSPSDQPSNVPTPQDVVQTVDKIHFDQVLKDKYNIDVNHLDAKSVLMLASLFHIFANEANLGADVNGNIAVGILNSNVDFGTRGDSVHLTQGDIYYIQQLNTGLQNGSFRNEHFNHVVFGQDVNVEIINGQVYVNGHHMVNLKPEEVFKDATGSNYIDFPTVFQRLLKASNFYASQEESAGVIKDFTDQNNRYVDVSNAVAKDNVIYVNIPFEYLTHPQPIKIFGLSSKVHGPTVVINVIGMPADGMVSISTQIKLHYDDEKNNHVNPGESHAHPNHVLWNFGETTAQINIGSGHFMGSLLAPNAHVIAGVNVDGNIIASIVDIKGGESHKWDIHPVEPPSFIVIPDPTDPQPTEPTQPTSPTQPTEQPSAPQPTEPEQPTEQPSDPQPTSPTQPTEQPTEPGTIEPPTVEEEVAGTTNKGDDPKDNNDAPKPGPTPVKPLVTHPEKTTTLKSNQPNQEKVTMASADAVSTSQTSNKDEGLPQTGAADNHGILLGIALAITAQLVIWGLVKPKKKK